MHKHEQFIHVRAKVRSLLSGLSGQEMRLLVEEAAKSLGLRLPLQNGEPEHESIRLCPSRLFSVSDEVRHLDARQLGELTSAVQGWYESARDERTRLARARFWLVYMLLRYSGAKLHEALTLDPERHIDLKQALLRLEGREVHLPRSVVDQIAQVLDSLGSGPAYSEAFRLDQGFVRRRLYDLAKSAGLPKGLVSPQAIRNSRAIELLRAGMPLPVVQAVLGHSNLQLTAGYFTFAPEDVRRIAEHTIRRAEGGRTSARNRFWGRVTQVLPGPVMSEVRLSVGGETLAAFITNGSLEALAVREGVGLGAMVKAPHVLLARPEDRPEASVNVLKARVTRIIADNVLAEVDGAMADGTPLCAVITAQALGGLGLIEGGEAWFFFSPMALVLNE